MKTYSYQRKFVKDIIFFCLIGVCIPILRAFSLFDNQEFFISCAVFIILIQLNGREILRSIVINEEIVTVRKLFGSEWSCSIQEIITVDHVFEKALKITGSYIVITTKNSGVCKINSLYVSAEVKKMIIQLLSPTTLRS